MSYSGSRYDNGVIKRPVVPLGLVIDRILDARGLSSKEVERRGGPEHSVISRWRNGTRNPKQENLHLFLDAVGNPNPIEVAALFESAGYLSPVNVAYTTGGRDPILQKAKRIIRERRRAAEQESRPAPVVAVVAPRAQSLPE